MSDLRDSIRRYHERMHPEHVGFSVDTLPTDLLAFRRRLHDEEVREVGAAWDEVEQSAPTENSVSEIGDELIGHLMHELADVVIVAFGTADYLGLDFDAILNAVMRANMRKVPPTEPGGKATKPAGWVPSDAVIVELIKASRSAGDPFAAPGRMPNVVPSSGPSRSFPAQYDGLCPDCGDEIEVGDMIVMTDDGAVHAECAS